MVFSSQNLVAAVAPQIAFDPGFTQAWTDIFVSAVQGVATLPLALILVWFIHRVKLDRWAILSAAIATFMAVIAAVLLELLGLNLWAAVVVTLTAIGVEPFGYELWPAVATLLIGSFFFALWLKRMSVKSTAEILE